MKVLVACEFSGIVRDAFIQRGHDAVSCDLLPTERPGPHIQGDAVSLSHARAWDLLIAFPPCTFLCSSGARWWEQKQKEQRMAIDFFLQFAEHTFIDKIAVENPIGIMSRIYVKPSQIIQPWMFGHGETKATCLWLRGLPNLKPTRIVGGREARIHKMPPSKNRWKERSRTYQGIANAMAEQWG